MTKHEQYNDSYSAPQPPPDFSTIIDGEEKEPALFTRSDMLDFCRAFLNMRAVERETLLSVITGNSLAETADKISAEIKPMSKQGAHRLLTHSLNKIDNDAVKSDIGLVISRVNPQWRKGKAK